MKLLRISVLLITTALAFSCAKPDAEPVTSTLATAEFFIPSDELPSLEQKALEGDIEANKRLHTYYAIYKADYWRGRFWLQIGAENGSPEAQYEFAKLLLSDLPVRDAETLEQDKERACFWLRRAIASKLPITEVYVSYLDKCRISKSNSKKRKKD
jgi:TPR repeat protein